MVVEGGLVVATAVVATPRFGAVVEAPVLAAGVASAAGAAIPAWTF